MAGQIAVGATVVVAFERRPPVAAPEMVSPVEPTTARTPALAGPPVIVSQPGIEAGAAYRTRTGAPEGPYDRRTDERVGTTMAEAAANVTATSGSAREALLGTYANRGSYRGRHYYVTQHDTILVSRGDTFRGVDA